jgi:hypothetical protein
MASQRARRTAATAEQSRRVRLSLAAAAALLIAVPAGAGALHTQMSRRLVPMAAPARLGSCQEQDLPLPTGIGSAYVTGSDATGRYITGIGYGDAADARERPLLWTAGVASVLAVPGTSNAARVVNCSGTVVGTGARTDGRPGSFVWRLQAGVVTELPLPDGYLQAVPEAVNASGDVAGTVFDGSSGIAVVWPSDGPEHVRVLTAADTAAATGIADDGTVTGWLGDAASAYTWSPTGEGRQLGAPAGYALGAVYAARGDWAVGSAIAVDSQAPTAVRWNIRTGAALAFPGFDVFLAVTARGDLQIPGSPPLRVVADGASVALPARLGARPQLVSVNDDGTQIVGFRMADDGYHPLVWRCG